ncbi:transporter substrate-binding domain-containing protein [Fusibacter paucivorans]|uniref:histidine kinase n=2 Tax=Fusibacter paucivorans TaxID=76009 RepID=A0ABS5PTW4_9FIRM|nr:transporter substrate-binding domain-containing protein [Fusibacter paucivorans]
MGKMGFLKRLTIGIMVCMLLMTMLVLPTYSEEVVMAEQVLRIGYDPTLPPYQFEENGEYKGLLLDLTQQLFNDMDQPIEFVPLPIENCIEAFKAKEIDIVLGLRFNAAYSEWMSYSDSLVNSTISIIMLQDKESEIKEKLGVEPLVIAVERNSTEFEFVKNIKKANFNNAFNQQTVADLMLLGRADMMVGVRHVAEYVLDQNGLADQYYISNTYVTPIDYYMAVHKDRVTLLNKINTELRNLKLSGTYEAIYNRWIDDKAIANQQRIQRILKIMGVVLSFVFLGALTGAFISFQLKRRVDEKTQELSTTNQQLERKIVEIKTTNELKNLIFESSPRSIVIFDKEGNVSAMNVPAQTICQLSEAPIGRSITSLHPLDKMLDGRLERILVDGESYHNQEFMVESHSRRHYYRFVVYPLADARGGIITIEDITEEKLLKERVAEREKNRALIQIVSGIAHEIRNPLTSIKTYAALLPRKKDNEAFQQQFSEVVPNEVDRVNALIENLIDYVKPKARNVESVHVQDLIQSCTLLFLPTINAHQMRLEMSVDQTLVIAVDKNQMKQVIINLILNAIEAVIDMRQYATTAEEVIAINARKEACGTIIEVIDNGVGMTSDELLNMFELFYTTKAKGSGIGMSLSKQMIEENHGTIEVRSEKYQGTTVRLIFGGEL